MASSQTASGTTASGTTASGTTASGTTASGTTASGRRASRHVVGRVDELPPGSSTFVPVGKFGVGVYNVGGEFRAVTNFCPHRGGPLCAGQRYPIIESTAPYQAEVSGSDEILKCPWHGWEFDLRDGVSEVGTKRIRMHAVRVEDGLVILEGV